MRAAEAAQRVFETREFGEPLAHPEARPTPETLKTYAKGHESLAELLARTQYVRDQAEPTGTPLTPHEATGGSALDVGSTSDETAPAPRSGTGPQNAEKAAPVEREKRERLPREQWHARELARLREKRRYNGGPDADRHPKRQAALERLKPTQEFWGAERTKAICRRRSTVRARVMDASSRELRQTFAQLSASARDKHFAIGLKRMARARGWALEDMCTKRRYAALEFLRESAVPHRWIPKTARAYRRRLRGLSSLEHTLDGMPMPGEPGWTPCVRAIAQPFLAGVIAAPGREDVHRRTVQRVVDDLVEFGLVQAVQVPCDEADAFEIGDSGWPTYRYYLAYADSPKPALMQCWGDDGEPVGLDVLAEPWLGAPQPTAASSPPAS